jgi:aerobic-type carbon monoxide dehydrogenase small subunit (CoxS/CutS family)
MTGGIRGVSAALHSITVQVNGRARTGRVEARLLLADFLRHDLGLTGTHVGCAHGVCGACTVMLDGRTARSCLTLAVQTDGSIIETVESLAAGGELSVLQQEFHRHHALQCGFCTPGMLISATLLLRQTRDPDEATIRAALSGNLCRCTGYVNIIRAVRAAAGRLAG